MIANTLDPPYYAVIFTSVLKSEDSSYFEMAQKMELLAKKQPGFLGIESARGELGISVSYWKSEDAILQWKNNLEHLKAQEKGRMDWYKDYKVRIAKVERDYNLG
jgi:heme-degrading monooxygenase HmoA